MDRFKVKAVAINVHCTKLLVQALSDECQLTENCTSVWYCTEMSTASYQRYFTLFLKHLFSVLNRAKILKQTGWLKVDKNANDLFVWGWVEHSQYNEHWHQV